MSEQEKMGGDEFFFLLCCWYALIIDLHSLRMGKKEKFPPLLQQFTVEIIDLGQQIDVFVSSFHLVESYFGTNNEKK